MEVEGGERMEGMRRKGVKEEKKNERRVSSCVLRTFYVFLETRQGVSPIAEKGHLPSTFFSSPSNPVFC